MSTMLKVVDVYKSFSKVQALKGVNLEIGGGEIHCLAGENGCGKSTLIKIISGIYTPDKGHIEIAGKHYTKIAPIEAIMNGIQVIYQDFSIFPNLTVMENIAYNSELASKKRIVKWKRIRETAKEAIAKINFHVDLDVLVGDLSIADKQLVAICRAIINNAKLIIMDEPTTALTNREVVSLFKVITELKKQGISILFVSHKLDEVFEISERFTIIRNGENVFSGKTNELDDKKFSFFMTGREFAYERFMPANLSEKPILSVSNMTLTNAFYDISFELRKGEILGITGLLGSGRTELALALFGALKSEKGSVSIDGKQVVLAKIQNAMENGIGYVPEDRLTEGLFLSQSIGDNIVISKIDELTKVLGLVDRHKKTNEINKWVENLSIATPDPDNAATTLSGGNQQRIVLAKWLSRDLKVLILNGPTVGVDIGSKHDIHKILQNIAAKGIGIIIISDDIPEILENCSRVLIMKAGKIIEELNTDLITQKELNDMMSAGIKN